MNIIASNGKVHRATGNRTACKVRIRDCWYATDEPLTCVRCGAPEPIVMTTVEPDPPAAPEVPRRTVTRMLDYLNCHIVAAHDGMLTISVIPDMPHVTIEVLRSDLRAWCERRIAARATHKNRCLRGGGGSPVMSKLRTS